MKRAKLLRHLRGHDCRLLREGANHAIIVNATTGLTAPVPRHNEIDKALVLKICKELKIPPPSDR